MKTWFDEKRLEMLNSAAEQVLSAQVQGALTFVDIMQLTAHLETHNDEGMRKNDINLALHNIDDIASELSQAIVAETVSMFDNKTISSFTWGAEKEHILDLSEEDDSTTSTPIYIGDKLTLIPQKMRKILDYFPDDGESFVLCTPLMISILQSAAKSKFVATAGGGFKGPNNTMLVGHADGAPVYSYFPEYKFGTEPNDEDLIILGNYQKGNNSAITQRLIVRNLSLA